ncbi:DUF255 domain-containing protein [Kocuria sp. M1R5S2]|uniref:DUF255 domain-containing protein n=1 Tax=Kocuria rhizosphaerae TaxID=3376285 RepID=UPI00379C3342
MTHVPPVGRQRNGRAPRPRDRSSPAPTCGRSGGWGVGLDAFEEAGRREPPILLLIGCAACHGCPVMVRKSFEEPEAVAWLNEHVVPVEVDGEERPDGDASCMAATRPAADRSGRAAQELSTASRMAA